MPPIPPPHLSQKVVKKCKIEAKEKSLGGTVASLRGVQATPSPASFSTIRHLRWRVFCNHSCVGRWGRKKNLINGNDFHD